MRDAGLPRERNIESFATERPRLLLALLFSPPDTAFRVWGSGVRVQGCGLKVRLRSPHPTPVTNTIKSLNSRSCVGNQFRHRAPEALGRVALLRLRTCVQGLDFWGEGVGLWGEGSGFSV